MMRVTMRMMTTTTKVMAQRSKKKMGC
uniref:Uncharacterized protein n=1 Tax=Anguilla anguilla TaxID=7936 RepID=A0A0E9QL62_ANGAN